MQSIYANDDQKTGDLCTINGRGAGIAGGSMSVPAPYLPTNKILMARAVAAPPKAFKSSGKQHTSRHGFLQPLLPSFSPSVPPSHRPQMATTDVEKRSFEETSVNNQQGDGGHMHRALKGRQVSMIAIAGTIGTGLFLGSGKALAEGGPVGAVLGYLIVGLLVGAMMYSLGEVCEVIMVLREQ